MFYGIYRIGIFPDEGETEDPVLEDWTVSEGQACSRAIALFRELTDEFPGYTERSRDGLRWTYASPISGLVGELYIKPLGRNEHFQVVIRPDTLKLDEEVIYTHGNPAIALTWAGMRFFEIVNASGREGDIFLDKKAFYFLDKKSVGFTVRVEVVK
jgi:hypothetical protein